MACGLGESGDEAVPPTLTLEAAWRPLEPRVLLKCLLNWGARLSVVNGLGGAGALTGNFETQDQQPQMFP